MYQPYYFNNYPQQQSYPQNYPQYPQQMQQPIQPIMQPEVNSLNAKYVSGYEEVKNIPYTEKPIMLLDSNAKKLYIKGLNEKGEKEIETYSLIEDNLSTSTELKKTTELDIDIKIENEINKVKDELQGQIKTLENQIKALKGGKAGN
ncbi:MAG: hypothetical protein ACI4U9_01630 [Clostridia bacterium]